MGSKKRKGLASPEYQCHNHKYPTSSKRRCCICSSIQESSAAVEHEIRNQLARTCHALKSRPCFRSLVACSESKTDISAWYKKLVASVPTAFPTDLLLNLLLPMPAFDLYEAMRCVSPEWRRTIHSPSFITDHLQLSSSSSANSILIVDSTNPHLAFYYEPLTNAGDSDYHVTQLTLPPFPSRIVASYHGLVLLQDLTNLRLSHLANLVTKSIVHLPPFPHSCMDCQGGRMTLSYASSIDRYKVVRVIDSIFDRPLIFVCTVGVDQSWRRIDYYHYIELGPGYSPATSDGRVLLTRPLSIRGIIYWSCTIHICGMALDVESEIVHKFPLFTRLLPDIGSRFHNGQFFSLQAGVGFFKLRTNMPPPTEIWELYELTDYKSSEWTKILVFDATVLVSEVAKNFPPGYTPIVTPLLYMKNGDFWFGACLGKLSGTYCYRSTGNVVRFPGPIKRHTAYRHVNTLVKLKNN